MTHGERPNSERGIVVLPQKVMEKIDRYREELSRAEFIEICIDALLNQGLPERAEKRAEEAAGIKRAGAEETVSRREFEEHKKAMKDLQHAYIDLFLNFVIEPAATASEEERAELVKRVRELLEEQ